jgi:hypothetical protein
MGHWIADLWSRFADLFTTDENIWAIALIILSAVLVVMIVKNMIMAVFRRVRNRPGN